MTPRFFSRSLGSLGSLLLLTLPCLNYAAVQYTLETSGTSTLQRLVLTSEMLTHFQTSEQHDVRIVNAKGETVPITKIQAATPLVSSTTSAKTKTIDLQPLPITIKHPKTEAPTTEKHGNLKLRIIEQQGRREVQVESEPTSLKPQPSTSTANRRTIGAFFDIRSLKLTSSDEWVMVIHPKLPLGQAIQFTLEGSHDLINWSNLSETTLLKLTENEKNEKEPNLGDSHLKISFLPSQIAYLRILWRSSEAIEEVPDVTLPSAQLLQTTTELTSTHPAPPSDRLGFSVPSSWLQATPQNPHQWFLNLPFASPLVGMDIKPTGEEKGVFPLQILTYERIEGTAPSRHHLFRRHLNHAGTPTSEQWLPLAEAIVYRLQNPQNAQINTQIIQESPPFTFFHAVSKPRFQILFHPSTPGMATAPQVRIFFEPMTLLFSQSGAGPFRLLIGEPNLKTTFLAPSSIMPRYQSGDENALPQATSKELIPLATSATSSSGETLTSSVDKKYWLWGILSIGIMILGGMIWVLVKGNQESAHTSEKPSNSA